MTMWFGGPHHLPGRDSYRRNSTEEATRPVPPSWVWIWEDHGPSDTCPVFLTLGSPPGRSPGCEPEPAGPSPSPKRVALAHPRLATSREAALLTPDFPKTLKSAGTGLGRCKGQQLLRPRGLPSPSSPLVPLRAARFCPSVCPSRKDDNQVLSQAEARCPAPVSNSSEAPSEKKERNLNLAPTFPALPRELSF